MKNYLMKMFNTPEEVATETEQYFGRVLGVGKENAINIRLVVFRYNLRNPRKSERKIREHIHDLRVLNVPILSTSNGDVKGYYISGSMAEIEEFNAVTDHRISELSDSKIEISHL